MFLSAESTMLPTVPRLRNAKLRPIYQSASRSTGYGADSNKNVPNISGVLRARRKIFRTEAHQMNHGPRVPSAGKFFAGILELVDPDFGLELLRSLAAVVDKSKPLTHGRESLAILRTKLLQQLQNRSDPEPVTPQKLLRPHPDTFVALLRLIYHSQQPAQVFDGVLAKVQAEISNQVKIVIAPTGAARADISNPARWFPKARQLKRNIIMHVGPTNSGKTHNALKRLMEAKSGYFAGPLRLLAREIYDRLNLKGVPCNLVTGEEIIETTDELERPAGIYSGTVEMISLTQEYEVVVLDEIQLMGSPDRGWAWTQALLGVRSKEIHLCGEESAVPLVRRICELTGDTVTVKKYQRLGKLEIESQAVGKSILSGIRKGDCIVSFNKSKILELKLLIESLSDFKVSVIYGKLPAETRVEQARAFNDGETDILVASDAVGLGLNLKINRIIFSTLLKFNGTSVGLIDPPHLKQIAGRAGRYQNDDSQAVGYVTCVLPKDLKPIKTLMSTPTIYLQKASLWPPNFILTRYIAEFPASTQLEKILRVFREEVESNELFYVSDLDNMIGNTKYMKNESHLLIKDQLRLLTAPFTRAGKNFTFVSKVISEYCLTIANNQTKTIFDFSLSFETLQEGENLGLTLETAQELLVDLENLHRSIMLYCWLGIRYPNYFVDRTSAVQLKNLCESRISEVLHSRYNELKKKNQQKHGRRKEVSSRTDTQDGDLAAL